MVGIASRKNRTASPVQDSPAKEKTSSKKNGKAKPATTITQFMRRFSKDTPGTLRFEAVSTDGTVMQQAESEINQLYVRRSSPAMGNDPRFLRITVEVLDKLPGSTEGED